MNTDILTSKSYTNEDAINNLIKTMKADTNKISDGYHTFEELYEHRIVLYIALCGSIVDTHYIWRSHYHSDGTIWDGWFILGIGINKGEQITYHLPLSKWSDTDFAETLGQSPKFDGHTSKDVLLRISEL